MSRDEVECVVGPFLTNGALTDRATTHNLSKDEYLSFAGCCLDSFVLGEAYRTPWWLRYLRGDEPLPIEVLFIDRGLL